MRDYGMIAGQLYDDQKITRQVCDLFLGLIRIILYSIHPYVSHSSNVILQGH